MNKLDVNSEIECMKEHQEKERIRKEGKGWLEFYPYSFEWAKGLEIESSLSTRPFKFDCGTDGEVADEVVVKIKFPKGTDVQPHVDFDYDFALACMRAAMENMNGHIENS